MSNKQDKTTIDITWRYSPDHSIGWCNICKSPIYNVTDPCACGLHGNPTERNAKASAALEAVKP